MWSWLPKAILFIVRDTGLLQISQEDSRTISNILFWGISISWTSTFFELLEKAGPNHSEDPSNIVWTSWTWDQYLPESMKLKFLRILNMGSISIRNHEMQFVRFSNFDSLKFWKIEPLNLWDFETLKIETLELYKFENWNIWNF